jgi:diguanylate cyclase (GGDEF)-like protein
MNPKEKTRLEKVLRERKLLQNENLVYQRLMEAMRKGMALGEFHKLIIQTITRGLGFDRAGLFLLEEGGLSLRLAMGVDAKGKYEKDLRFQVVNGEGMDPFSDIIFGHKKYFLTNQPLLRRLKRVKNIQRIEKVNPGILNHAIVPLEVGQGEVIGLLAVDNLFKPRRITKADIAILTTFATQAGLAIESYGLHEKITNLTITDPLTGVFNRRYFDRCLSTEILRCQRYNRTCGLLYADIDHFKSVNDRWGHSVGDEVLKSVAFSLRAGVRNLDTVCRIGGEEFAVILPETPVEGMRKVAERLVDHVAGTSAAMEAEKVTISIGVSSFPDSAKDFSALVGLADKSLYKAKESGRNRVGPLLNT